MAVVTLLDPKCWSKGNPEAVIKWLRHSVNKALRDTDKEKAEGLQDIAIALVVNHGVRLETLPEELIPDAMKNPVRQFPQLIDPFTVGTDYKKQRESTQQVSEGHKKPWYNPF